jgi:hypothetical protein
MPKSMGAGRLRCQDERGRNPIQLATGGGRGALPVRNAAEWFEELRQRCGPLPLGPMALAQQLAWRYRTGSGSLRNPVPSVIADVDEGQPEGRR